MAQGLIDAGQAARIGAAEPRTAAPSPAPVPGAEGGRTGPDPGASPRRLPLAVEALGYLGAVFAVVAGFIAVGRLWPAIPADAELALAGVAAGVLLLAGAVLPTDGHPEFGRLRSALWLNIDRQPRCFCGPAYRPPSSRIWGRPAGPW